MVQGSVDLAVSGVDGVEVARRGFGMRVLDKAGEWTEESGPELDQEDAKSQSERSHAVASGSADTLDETFRAELAQVVPKLAEAVLVPTKVVASNDACVHSAGRPVADEAAWMEQCFQQADDSIVMQFEAGDAAQSDHRWCSQRGELASVHRAGQQLGLFGEATLIGGGQLLAQQWQVVGPGGH